MSSKHLTLIHKEMIFNSKFEKCLPHNIFILSLKAQEHTFVNHVFEANQANLYLLNESLTWTKDFWLFFTKPLKFQFVILEFVQQHLRRDFKVKLFWVRLYYSFGSQGLVYACPAPGGEIVPQTCARLLERARVHTYPLRWYVREREREKKRVIGRVGDVFMCEGKRRRLRTLLRYSCVREKEREREWHDTYTSVLQRES